MVNALPGKQKITNFSELLSFIIIAYPGDYKCTKLTSSKCIPLLRGNLTQKSVQVFHLNERYVLMLVLWMGVGGRGGS